MTSHCDCLKQRHRRDRLAQHLSQSFDNSEADPKTGERARTRGHGKSAEIVLAELVLQEKSCNLGDEFSGKGSASEGNDLDNVAASIRPGVGQRNAAMFARGIDGEKEHSGRFLSLFIPARRNPQESVAALEIGGETRPTQEERSQTLNRARDSFRLLRLVAQVKPAPFP